MTDRYFNITSLLRDAKEGANLDVLDISDQDPYKELQDTCEIRELMYDGVSLFDICSRYSIDKKRKQFFKNLYMGKSYGYHQSLEADAVAFDNYWHYHRPIEV